VTNNFVKSTTIAATIGRVFGLMLVFTGMMFSVALDAPGFLWLVFIGTFLDRLAYISEYRTRMMYGRPEVDETVGSRVISMTPYPEYYSNHDGWSRPEE
jgi:hypothetical protein